jgi:hypothetical protein
MQSMLTGRTTAMRQQAEHSEQFPSELIQLTDCHAPTTRRLGALQARLAAGVERFRARAG